MRKYFAVGFRASHAASDTLHLSVEIVAGTSARDAASRAHLFMHPEITLEQGWSDIRIDVRAIDPCLIARVAREAAWVDQNGAHRLYAVVLYLHNTQTEQGSVNVGAIMTWNEDCLASDIRHFVEKNYPASEGWELVKCDAEEWDEVPRRHARKPIQWVPPQIKAH